MSESRRSLAKWWGPVFLALVFLSLTAWSWRKWADILVDFGRELYIPWQLSTGKVLYLDVFYFNGPFSPYLNALWFKIFGVSFTTLILCNLAILACLTVLMFLLIKKSSDALTATISCFVFLCAFAFADLEGRGNFNYICPYDHSLTHGVTLSFLMIYVMTRYIQRQRLLLIIIAGGCIGLLFLTKAELFVPNAIVSCTGIALNYIVNHPSKGKFIKITIVFALSIMLSIFMFNVYLLNYMSISNILNGISGNWQFIFNRAVLNVNYYQRGLGFDQPFQNIILSLISSSWIIAIFCFGIIADTTLKRNKNQFNIIMFIIISILIVSFFLLLIYFKIYIILYMLSRSLLFLLIVILITYYYFYKSDVFDLKYFAPIIMLSILGLLLLFKMILNVRINHYGFVLAMPATISVVVFLVYFVPNLLIKKTGGGNLFRGLAILIFVAFSVYTLVLSDRHYNKKNFVLGGNGDRLLTYGQDTEPFGQALNKLIQYININISPLKSFTVMPEGVMINYLTRRPAPIPFIVFLPLELSMVGENAIIKALEKNLADYVILIDRPTPEYNVNIFGTNYNYGYLIMNWIKTHYKPVYFISYQITNYPQYGINLFKKK